MTPPPFELRRLPGAVRLALTLLLLVNLGGFVASGLHLEQHHQGRDEREGLSLDDLTGAYHGIESPAPLLAALELGHPTDVGRELADADRTVLLEWLRGERITEDYDNLDLGLRAPAEILDAHCLECHRRGASGEHASNVPLEYFDDVKAVAHSREVPRTPTEILILSTHTHAIALASISLILAALTFLTRWPSALRSALILGPALGLALDLAAWWLAREHASFVLLIVGGGALYMLASLLALLAIIVDLWRPLRG